MISNLLKFSQEIRYLQVRLGSALPPPSQQPTKEI